VPGKTTVGLRAIVGVEFRGLQKDHLSLSVWELDLK